nr:hypothetical protein [uncultured bacterium]
MAHLQRRPRVPRIREIKAFVSQADTQVRHAAKLWRLVPNVTSRLLLALFLIMNVVGCEKQDPDPEQRSAKGLMKHYPSNVQSIQSWQGHNFIVGDTPVIPTESVTDVEMQKYIGKTVIVTGIWHSGQEWTPSENEKDIPALIMPDNQVVIRGDGLKVSSIKIMEQ